MNEAQYLGRHTTLSYLAGKTSVWRRLPYLGENDGRGPPIVLAAGDRRRVHLIARKLQKPLLVPEAAARLSNPGLPARHLPSTPEFGRVAMAIGMISSIPILVLETQMGASATQIVMKEILSDELTSTDYRAGRTKVRLPRKIVIRVGTAGGINCEGLTKVKVGDVVNATHSLGASGAIIQSLSRLDFWHPEAYEIYRTKWKNLGPAFTFTKTDYPKVECSKNVIEALEDSGRGLLKGTYHTGGNVTKDSLYAELNADMLLNVCRTEKCRTTDMELSAIAAAAGESKADFGMISAIVGLLPGQSFAGSQAAVTAEERALQVALRAIRCLV